MAKPNKTYQPVQQLSIEAGEELPAFRFVSHLGTLCTSDTKSLGVSEVDWLSGELASIVSLGTIPIETSTAINIGDDVTSDASGKATPAGSESKINGRAIDGCTGPSFIRINLVP